jgi:hypothetical protein
LAAGDILPEHQNANFVFPMSSFGLPPPNFTLSMSVFWLTSSTPIKKNAKMSVNPS